MAPQILPPLRLTRKQVTNPKSQEFKIIEPTIALQVLPPIRLKRKQTINTKSQEFKIIEPSIAPQVLPPLRLKRKRSRYQEFKISESGTPAEETRDSSFNTDSNEKEDFVVRADEKHEGVPEQGEPEPLRLKRKRSRYPEFKISESGPAAKTSKSEENRNLSIYTDSNEKEDFVVNTDEKHDGEPDQGVAELGEPEHKEPECVFKTRQYYDQGVLVTEWDFCPYSKIEEKIKKDLVFQGKECNSVNVMKYVEKSCNPIAYEELCKRRFGSTL